MMKRVLVIDDSEVNLYLIKTIFEEDPGIHIQLLSSSKDALSVIREGSFDLIVLDLMMPYLDGFQLLHQIKADPGLNSIPIIVISARHDQKSIDEVMKYEVQDYVKKPISLQDVEHRIRGILSHEKV